MKYIIDVSIMIVIQAIAACGLNVIVGYAGQISLGHAAFFGIGAYASAMFTTKLALTFWQALPLVLLIAALIGLVLGLPSLRLREDFLAITTIGINFIVEAVFLYMPFFGAALGIGNIPPVVVAGTRLRSTYYLWLCLAFLLLSLLVCRWFVKSWAGLACFALREDETAASSMGISPVRTKLSAFVLGTLLAGLAGALYAHHMRFISPGDFSFPVSISMLSMVVLGGMGTLWGPILGAVILGVLPELFRPIADYRMFLYAMLLLLMIRFQPGGLLGEHSFLMNLLRWLAGRSSDNSEALLSVRNLSIHFGGLKAVDNVSFDVHSGEILGLLGPNGAGKTTCFNAISGVYRPTAGVIYLNGKKTNGLPPHRMAALGVGRTFQIVRPFSGLSVLDNIVVALGGFRYRGNFTHSLSHWRNESIVAKARSILETVGLSDMAERRAGLLPIGNLRRLEIARALALRPRLLLLDESFSGLRHAEILQIEKLIRSIRDGGIAVLLIEHNMKVAMGLSDRIIVLDHGRKLAEGLPADVSSNPDVIEAYLGKGESGHVA